MTTVDQLIDQTLVELRGFVRDRATALTGSVTSSQATIPVDLTQGQPDLGDYLSIGTESLLVTGGAGTATLTVLRGQLGTTAATHASADVVYIAPRFPRGVVFNELLREIRSWPRQLYTLSTLMLSLSGQNASMDFNPPGGAVLRVVTVKRKQTDGMNRWVDVPFQLIKGLTADAGYSKNMALQVRDFQYDQAVDLYVTYAQEFDLTAWATTTNVENTCGIPARMFDIAIYGTASRLLLSREVERTDDIAQGQTRYAEENPPGTIMRAAQGLQQVRDRRLSEEIAHLQGEHGLYF